MRLLFVKEALSWPRSSGHDVHCFHMMRALTELGNEVSLLTVAEPAQEAIAGLSLRWRGVLPGAGERIDGPEPRLSRFQERFRNYWGIDANRICAVGRAADECAADAVVVIGLNVLPYLGAVHDRIRIWYAADEWFWHHLSQIRVGSPSTWREMRQAVIKGLYERAYAPLLHRVWVVTDADRRAMQRVAGVRNVDVIPNGIDGEHYQPMDLPQHEHSCTFWGRLDFGPNIQALEWFCQRVWPLVRRAVPGARFTIYGFNPTEAVRAITGRDGIELIPDLPDLRQEIARHQVVVLPFVSGGGIKNKLLEAASMGKAILCSTVACGGLRLPGGHPFALARTPDQWAQQLVDLWQDAGRRQKLGEDARRWVVEQHSWQTAACQAAVGLEESLQGARH